MTVIAFIFWNLRTPKMLLDNCLKPPVSEDRSTSKTADLPKNC